LNTITARLGAVIPLSPCRHDAVNGAGVAVACLGSAEHGAGLAAVSDAGGDGTGTALGASTAGEAAGRPGRPARYDAVDGASIRVAGAGLGKERAAVATVFGVSHNLATAALGAIATGEAAGRPCRECGHFAVDGARTVSAALLLGEHGAGDAAVGNSSGDGTGTRLGA